MASKPEAQEPAVKAEPGPLDVTAEEALDQMTLEYAELMQQNVLLRIRIGKQSAMIQGLQTELARDA